MTAYDQVIYERVEDSIAFIRLNNSENRNALSVPMRRELVLALDEAANDSQVRVIILTGVGENFSAGGDLKTMGDYSAQDARNRIKLGHQSLMKIRIIEIPVIAMIRGYAAGGGMNLALACDMILAADDAIFVQSFVRVGLIPDVGGMYILPRLIGVHLAKELMFTGRRINADQARQIGLLNAVYPPERLEEETLNLARSICEGPPYALGLMKKLINDSLDLAFPAALELEAASQALCFGSMENLEGIEAFMEKRKPKFNIKTKG